MALAESQQFANNRHSIVTARMGPVTERLEIFEENKENVQLNDQSDQKKSGDVLQKSHNKNDLNKVGQGLVKMDS